MENLTGGTPPVRYLLCVVPCKLYFTEYKEAKTGVHAIRKMYATEAYLERINSGMGKEEAWGEVSEILGHGKDRMDLFRVYVKV